VASSGILCLSFSVTDVSQSKRRKNAHLGERSTVDSCQRCSGHGTLVTSDVWTLFYERGDKAGILVAKTARVRFARDGDLRQRRGLF